MARLDDLKMALVNADKAGDTDAARMLAAEIVKGQTAEYNPTEGQSFAENAWQSFGGTLPRAGQAVQQMAYGFQVPKSVQEQISSGGGFARPALTKPINAERLAEVQAEVDETKRLEAPLMKTAGGVIGRIAGNVAIAAPAAFVPGANTAVGSAIIGAGMGALEPTATGESRAANAALGAGSGAVGYGAGKLIGKGISAAKQRVASAAAEKTQNAARDATLSAAKEAGYVVPPSEANPNFVTNVLERWAGKASVSQSASLKNQKVTNALVRKSLDLPKDTPITPETLTPIKQAAWSVYEQTRKLGTLSADQEFDDAVSAIAAKSTKLNPMPEVEALTDRLRQATHDADDVVTAIQTFRGNASARLKPMNLDAASRNLGKAEAKAAEALEGLIERNAGQLGPKALQDFKMARVTLGKVGTVERAMLESTGDVSARKLGQELAKGKPLTGELKTAAKFAQAYPRSNQMNVNPVQGGSPLDVAAAGVSAASGSPGISSLLLARPIARGAVMSSAFQGQQSYNPLVSLAVSKLPNPPARTAQALGILAPSISTANR